MKIICDISILGRHRMTGVPRVIEEITRGLFYHPECELIFCADKNSYLYAKKYLESIDYFSGYTLSKPDTILPFLFLTSCIRSSSGRIKELKSIIKNGGRHKFILKAGKELLNYTRKGAGFFIISDISRKDLMSADIYHLMYPNLPRYVRRYDNLSFFQTIHDIIPILCPQYIPDGSGRLIKSYINWLAEKDFLLCVSNSTRNDLLNYNRKVNPDRVFVTHLAVSGKFCPCESPEEIERVKRKYKIPKGSRYILSVATFDPRKNLDILIRSFVRLIELERISDLSLVLVGRLGWGYEKIFQEIEDNSGVRDRIIITGYVDDVDLSPMYTGCLAFVYPSAYEGFGLPPLEAMACGAPVITSNTSSLPEVVGGAGIMVAPGDADGLSEAICKICRSESLRQDMSRRSLERAKLFSWEKCVDQTVAAYKKALAMK
ncbi:MAG: glycosyltransferase family 1 protein [Candidatus Omnitrophota bacterium]